MKSTNQRAMDLAAIALMQAIYPKAQAKGSDPRDNLDWIKLNHLYRLNLAVLQEATFAVTNAKAVQDSVIKATNETRAQLELLAIELGICLEDDSNE